MFNYLTLHNIDQYVNFNKANKLSKWCAKYDI